MKIQIFYSVLQKKTKAREERFTEKFPGAQHDRSRLAAADWLGPREKKPRALDDSSLGRVPAERPVVFGVD
jgi:hypothetical protein